MNIYLRKVFSHDINKQISITKEVVTDFFNSSPSVESSFTLSGKNSKFKGEITILVATDPRFGGDIKKIINAEGDMEENDILLFIKNKTSYQLEIIKNNDSRYQTFISMMDIERHLLMSFDDNEQNFEIENVNQQEEIRNNIVRRGQNLLVYGVPGSGKSWTVKNKLCPPNAEVRRVVFHPEYTYGDFVGKILPTSSETGEISYQFIPGPFTSILKEAYNHSDKEYVLIIEEINRGNAPAIFGDSFQLLDRIRDQSEAQSSKLPIGCSQYGIFNENMAKVIFEPNSEDGENSDSSKAIKNREIRIPANLSIIATMNTSDQNVFTLDTAFQRRWNMMQVKNSFEDKDPNFINHKILDTDVTWMVFCTFINNLILESNSRLSSMEDKRLGVYFIGIDDLDFYSDAPNLNMVSVPNLDEIVSESNEKKEGVLDTVKDKRLKESFSQKVLKYLWDDAFKFNREKLFNVEQCKSLEAVFDLFRKENKNDRFNVFNLNVKHDLLFQNDQENKGNNNSQRIYHG